MPILQFKGKTAVESYHRVVPHHTLEIDPSPKFSLAKKPSLDGNLILEGDNLIALKSLLPTHAGRIKCIYIDPPYNTNRSYECFWGETKEKRAFEDRHASAQDALPKPLTFVTLHRNGHAVCH